jgi:hypothetical protein
VRIPKIKRIFCCSSLIDTISIFIPLVFDNFVFNAVERFLDSISLTGIIAAKRGAKFVKNKERKIADEEILMLMSLLERFERTLDTALKIGN